MNSFTIALYDSAHCERFDGIVHFIGADDHGSFGILPKHEPLVVVLRYGLARFLDSAGKWHYLALPGGIVRFSEAELSLVTERYFLGEHRELLADRLAAEMAQEDSELHAARTTLAGIERTLISRLNELTQHGMGEMRR